MTYPADALTPAFTINLDVFSKGDTFTTLSFLDAVSVRGVATAKLTLRQPSDALQSFTVPLTIDPQDVPTADPGDVGVQLASHGSLPRFRLDGFGTASITLDSISLSLGLTNSEGQPVVGLGTTTDSDKDANTFDAPCSGPAVKLGEISVAGTPNPTPTPTPVPLMPTPTPTPTLPPVGTPTPSPTPTPTLPPVGTPTPSPTPTPTGTLVDYGYSLAGKATLKTLTTGVVNVTGDVAAKLNLATGAYTGTTKLNDASANLQAVRVLPITATLTFVEVGGTSGTLASNTLVANTRQLIRLRSAKAFGINLVSNSCVTSKPSAITLKSASAGSFKPLQGGSIGGSFAIAPLTNCGALNGLVSGLTAGNGNLLAVNLVAKQ